MSDMEGQAETLGDAECRALLSTMHGRTTRREDVISAIGASSNNPQGTIVKMVGDGLLNTIVPGGLRITSKGVNALDDYFGEPSFPARSFTAEHAGKTSFTDTKRIAAHLLFEVPELKDFPLKDICKIAMGSKMKFHEFAAESDTYVALTTRNQNALEALTSYLSNELGPRGISQERITKIAGEIKTVLEQGRPR